jgi:hypothetical protein
MRRPLHLRVRNQDSDKKPRLDDADASPNGALPCDQPADLRHMLV